MMLLDGDDDESDAVLQLHRRKARGGEYLARIDTMRNDQFRRNFRYKHCSVPRLVPVNDLSFSLKQYKI